MVELELTSSKILVGGIAAILTGILLAIGADIWSIAKDWMLTPTLDLRFVISVSLLVLGIIGVAYALHAMLREEIVGVTAHLFFPSEAAVENRTTKFYNEELRKRLTVERLFSNLPIAIRAVNDLVSATIEGTISGSNPVNWKKVRVGLTSVVIGMPIVFLSAVYDTPYGQVGLALGAAMAGSGFQTINDGLA